MESEARHMAGSNNVATGTTTAGRVLAAALLAVYISIVLVVGVNGARYDTYLDGMVPHLPQLTIWALGAYKFTPLFLVASFPLILYLVASRTASRTRHVFFVIACTGLLVLAAWTLLMWIALGSVVAKFEAIAP